MAKEAKYSMMRMSRRLMSKNGIAYEQDETQVSKYIMPSFLHKKASEGEGMRQALQFK